MGQGEQTGPGWEAAISVELQSPLSHSEALRWLGHQKRKKTQPKLQHNMNLNNSALTAAERLNNVSDGKVCEISRIPQEHESCSFSWFL